MLKKVYVEITNNCNLNCDFCHKNRRTNKFISIDEFKIIINKLEGYTNYLYFHVLGEPLLHPNINEFIDLASNKYKINITTNGYLLNRIKDNKNIRQINISLHSYDGKIPLENYLNNIFESVKELKNYTYISYRLWVDNKFVKEIVESINKEYNSNIDYNNLKHTKLDENIFLDINEEFIWPDLNNEYYNEIGTCYALRDHIGILVDGTIIPCCLDSDGIIKLGNIYNQDLESIINSNRYQNMLDGFKNNKKCEELCKHCNFIK